MSQHDAEIKYPALAEAHRTLKVGSPVTDALIAQATSQAVAAHTDLVSVAGASRRVDPRTKHLGEAVEMLIRARPRTDVVAHRGSDLALAVATARTNDYILDAIADALRALDAAATREADLA